MILPDSETKTTAAKSLPLSFGINGRVDPDFISKNSGAYLRSAEPEIRQEERARVGVQEAEVEIATKTALEATAQEAQEEALEQAETAAEASAQIAAVVGTMAAVAEVRLAYGNSTYIPDYNVGLILTSRPETPSYRLWPHDVLSVYAGDEYITAPPSRLQAIATLTQNFVPDQSTAALVPVFSSSVELTPDPEHNEPAKRRPAPPTRQKEKLMEWSRSTKLGKVLAARKLVETKGQ